jgi:hypothetical protein
MSIHVSKGDVERTKLIDLTPVKAQIASKSLDNKVTLCDRQGLFFGHCSQPSILKGALTRDREAILIVL